MSAVASSLFLESIWVTSGRHLGHLGDIRDHLGGICIGEGSGSHLVPSFIRSFVDAFIHPFINEIGWLQRLCPQCRNCTHTPLLTGVRTLSGALFSGPMRATPSTLRWAASNQCAAQQRASTAARAGPRLRPEAQSGVTCAVVDAGLRLQAQRGETCAAVDAEVWFNCYAMELHFSYFSTMS